MAALSSRVLQEQLSAIMGALTKAVVAEICELVDEGYALLQMEISRSRKENQDLKNKLHLIESILPEVVLIKDEDSDTEGSVGEDGAKPSEGGAAASCRLLPVNQRARRRRTGSPERDGRSVLDQPSLKVCRVAPGPQMRSTSGFVLDAPWRRRRALRPLCCWGRAHRLVHQEYQQLAYFGDAALMESDPNRTELDFGLMWERQSRSQPGFVHSCPHGSPEGDELRTTAGSMSTDSQLSESGSSGFEYENVAPPAAQMSPVAAFHAQLASIMEVLANTAVAEICELVDSGYSELQLEIARSRRENEQLRRKLRLMELRAARASALRALAGGGGARAPVPGHHGDHARRARAQRGEAAAASSAAAQERGSSGPPGASGPVRATPTAEAVAPTIKIEDGGASWSPSELNQEFCSVVAEETEAPPTSIKQEVSEESDGSRCASWMCDVTSSCWSIQQTPNTDPVTTQNPLREEPGHSLALNATVGVSSDSGGGGLSLKEAVAERQQGAPLPPDRPQLPARKAAADRPNAHLRRHAAMHAAVHAAVHATERERPPPFSDH
ncbi:hypothetical protein fugu_013897 [Takifugu bimaculatus]|uniref:Uncharacterized protein n=1 Tax=Takifugu bimaculatus TaxID=433685 RepID=A0A4Z2BZQ6_9TELE|nr:hypothetical protein fugu_013897 [Takifugu bimaculatus]